MPSIHVCALSKIGAVVQATGAGSLVSLINQVSDVVRPPAIKPTRHMFVGIADIVSAQDGFVLSGHQHVAELLAFVKGWDRRQPMVIHCFAGVSRSTAAAFIAACALQPDRAEAEIATQIRALSPTATPNPRLVALADDVLQRDGRMVAAVERIGRGADCFEGMPFALEMPARAL